MRATTLLSRMKGPKLAAHKAGIGAGVSRRRSCPEDSETSITIYGSLYALIVHGSQRGKGVHLDPDG